MTAIDIQPLEHLTTNKASYPDKYTLNTNKFVTPNDNFVISRDKYGKTLSVYSDNVWDLTPYSNNGLTKYNIYFKRELNCDITIMQFKRLFFLIMIMGYWKINSGFSASSLFSLSSFIYSIALNAQKNKKTLFQFLANTLDIRKFILDNCDRGNNAQQLSTLLHFLQKNSNDITGVMFKIDEQNYKMLSKIINHKKANTKQTEVIPSSILCNSIKIRWEQINEINKYSNSISKFIENCINSKYFACSKKFQGIDYTNNETCIFWDQAIEEYKIIKLFKKYNINNKHKLKAFIRKIQGTCYHIILAYTGMRRSEALSLKENCLKLIKDKKQARLIGFTTKFESTKKEVSWVTTYEIEKVISLLNQISKSLSIKLYFEEGERFLFISTTNLTSKPLKEPVIVAAPYLNNDTLYIDSKLIEIKDNHIKELEELDYSRDWRNEKNFKIGQPWYFKTHQYRRSLAVYSIQSDLVSLGSLQQQYKHLFREMSFYYQNGSINARNILDIHQNHISKTINNIKPEVEALTYIKEVLFSNEPLYGVHGNIVTNMKKEKYKNDNLLILQDRQKTINDFKNGHISWKETMIGGCIQLETCNSRLMRSLVECIGCNSAVHKLSKLEKSINTLKKYISLLDPKSIEYRTEKDDLNKLTKYYNNLKRVKNGNS
jgi:hypothetical protein